LYDDALGDVRFSYNPADLEEITRQLLYLKPDVFIIYDRIRVTAAGYRMTDGRMRKLASPAGRWTLCLSATTVTLLVGAGASAKTATLYADNALKEDITLG
jgi:hypothetical protein